MNVNSSKDSETRLFDSSILLEKKLDIRMFINRGTPLLMTLSSELLSQRFQTWKAFNQLNCSKIIMNGHPF